MARSRSKTAEATVDRTVAETGGDFFDEQIATREAEAAARVHQTAPATDLPADHTGHATRHAPAGSGHAAGLEKKKYTPPVDPFGFENLKAGENRVRLLKSEGESAWVIRFAHNPNEDKGFNGETYSKETPHPVLKMLKKEGFRWGFDGGDNKGGWGKAFTGDAYGADHIEARRVLQQAAEMIGQPKDKGRLPD